jgi:protoporphyrinogen oxidase
MHVERGRLRAIAFSGRPTIEVPGPVVSTLPLPTLVRLLGDAVPEQARTLAATLRFRHLRIVFLRLAVARCSPNATIYLPDPRLAVSRISEPKNRSVAMAPAHETGLVCEMPCFAGDALHALDETALAERLVGELAGAGLIDAGKVLGWRHHFLPNAYPVYALDYADAVYGIRSALARVPGLDLLGRAGTFWYSHLHDQLRSARDYVRSLRTTRGTADAEHLTAHADVRRETVPGPAAA